MIYLFFFLKFKAQLRRTRPEIIRQIDESLTRAVIDAGGNITGDRFVISAVFNEETIGFWLDIFILIENLKKNIETSSELYGFSLVISSKTPDTPEMLCRFLANHSGVFVNDTVARKLIPYAVFEKPAEWLKGFKKRKYGCGSYYRIKELRNFKKFDTNESVISSDIAGVFEKETGKNTLISGTIFSQLHSGLFLYCSNLNKDFPPLSINFGSAGIGALVDIWSPSIRSIDAAQSTEEIDKTWEFLFRERIRDEVSDFVIQCVKKFLKLVFEYYCSAAKKKKRTPVLALENIHIAGNKITSILIEVLHEFNQDNLNKFIILGTGEDDALQGKLHQWENVFSKAVKIEEPKQTRIYYPKLSPELWEIVYAISLMGRYFSPELFQRLFEEEEKNPIMIARAFSILYNMGIIDNLREPRPVNKYYEEHGRKLLGEKTIKIKELVNRRLLSWAGRRNINPCWRLLSIITKLNNLQEVDDLMLLKSVFSDIINETTSGIESAINSGQFEDIAKNRTAILKYIYKTSKVLHTGDENEIDKVFSVYFMDNLNVENESYTVLKTQMLINQGAYYLGKNDKKMSSEKAKEAILLGQSKNLFCLPQCYRIFALVCLTKQQAVETIEYLGFALANAEKSGNYLELAISTYYAAAAQFLYGDVFNAARLARKSVEHSLSACRSDWADRSRFLEGRLEFELGRYQIALDIFEGLRSEPFGEKTIEKDSLFAAWIYRCKIYFHDTDTQNTKVQKPQNPSYDADLFEMEAAYLSGDFKKTIEIANSLDNPYSKGNFLYTEQADWRSGFAQCEHLFFNNGEIQDRMILLFRSLALCGLQEGSGEEALQGIQQILRDEKLCEMDPWDAFYFFAKYQVLQHTGASLVDLSTAVSMAFKRLQRRAGRIEDIETRRQYLNVPKWNSELSHAAKEYKLI